MLRLVAIPEWVVQVIDGLHLIGFQLLLIPYAKNLKVFKQFGSIYQ